MRGLEIVPSLADLRPIFGAWLDLWERASRAFPERQSFYFLEKTLASLISAAAWSCGVPSITEAKVVRQSGSGRVDLLVLSERAPTAMEVKLRWFGDPDGPKRELLPALTEAEEQLRRLPSDLAKRHLALAIAVFESGSTPLERLLERTRTLEEAPLLAWNVELTSPSLYPGICAVGRLHSAVV